MRVPLTRYGWPQVVVLPAVILVAMAAAPLLWPQSHSPWPLILLEAALGVTLVWTLTFFRDPQRSVPQDGSLLLAPADGRITNVEIVNENDFIAGPAIRIGIFLSIFDVHINRAPCNVSVEKITYRPGKYKNAMSPAAARINESNDLALVRTDSPQDRLLVRQVSGAVARRIVCATERGQKLNGGEKFGMIKFGSRTELYLPVRQNAKCLARIGDKVKAGLSPLVRYEECPD